jgi:hypothetical protein
LVTSSTFVLQRYTKNVMKVAFARRPTPALFSSSLSSPLSSQAPEKCCRSLHHSLPPLPPSSVPSLNLLIVFLGRSARLSHHSLPFLLIFFLPSPWGVLPLYNSIPFLPCSLLLLSFLTVFFLFCYYILLLFLADPSMERRSLLSSNSRIQPFLPYIKYVGYSIQYTVPLKGAGGSSQDLRNSRWVLLVMERGLSTSFQ